MILMNKAIKKINFIWNVFCRYKNNITILWSLFRKKIIRELDLRNGVVLYGSSMSTLLAISDEIFFEKVYTPHPLKIQPGDVVIDIGANIGIFSIFAEKCRAKKIIACEPFPPNLKLIQKNVKKNKCDSITVVPMAISDHIGMSKMYLTHLDAGNLLFDHTTIGTLTKYIEIKTVTLEMLVKIYKLEHIDFLKIDCEGSEGNIILSTPDYIWKKVNQIAMEYHDHVSILDHRKIEKKFIQLGFKTKVVPLENPEFGYVYAWREN